MTGDQEERTQQKMVDLGALLPGPVSPPPPLSTVKGKGSRKGQKGLKVKSGQGRG